MPNIKKDKTRVKTLTWILFLISLICEALGIILVLTQHGSICVQAYEVAAAVMVFLAFVSATLFPDLCYVVLMLFMPRVGKDPLTIMYNVVLGLISLIGGVVLVACLTYCGNPAQIVLLVGGILGALAGLLHLLNGGLSHWQLPEGETYIQTRT